MDSVHYDAGARRSARLVEWAGWGTRASRDSTPVCFFTISTCRFFLVCGSDVGRGWGIQTTDLRRERNRGLLSERTSEFLLLSFHLSFLLTYSKKYKPVGGDNSQLLTYDDE